MEVARRGCAGSVGAQCSSSRPYVRYIRGNSMGRLSSVRARASAAEVELDEIDPITGLVISKSSSMSSVAGFRCKAGGFEWAYRKSEPDAAKANADKPEVLLLHGIGSSSYSYRNSLALLGGDGYTAYAPDWLGHGDSDKPAPGSGFGYTQRELVDGLAAFVDAIGIRKPFALVVQGYILSQAALLYAREHQDDIDRLLILNMPLATNSKLRPELAAYKAPLPFMRPGNKPFDGMIYNMQGSPYAMQEKDALAYGRPYREEPAASAAVGAIMDKVDFKALLSEVDDAFTSWRKPSVVLWGPNDPFLPVSNPFAWVENKRTNIKVLGITGKLGHMPQEDYPEAIHETMAAWLAGVTDDWTPGKLLRFSNKDGAIE